MTHSIRDLTAAVLAFRDEREWGQFHTLKNLLAGLSIEAAELQELVLWKSEPEIAAALVAEAYRRRVAEELADVMIYLLLAANRAGIDVGTAVTSKLAANALKYPVSLSRGNAKKYTELTDGAQL